MSIWGKIFGGAAGFALGGPLGALIGAVAGHAVDSFQTEGAANGTIPGPTQDARPTEDATQKIAFTIGVIALGAKMAKADGAVTHDEIAAFREVFHVPSDEIRNVGRVFDLARRDSGGFEPYARQIARLFDGRDAVLEDLLDGLFHIAKADGALHPAEIEYLREVAYIFGFTADDFDRIKAVHGANDGDDPYGVLGISREASDASLKAAYRKLIREHHPDRLIAQGLPTEFIAIANDKMATINAAYDRIRKERGLN